MSCYRNGGCGPYEMLPCNECPASKPEYAEKPQDSRRLNPVRKCDVCGKIDEVYVAASACGATSFAYCKECLESGAEPWGALVFYISCGGIYPNDISQEYQEIVRNTCRRLGRTEDEFAKDVLRKVLEDYEL